jgi:hypothetical protein
MTTHLQIRNGFIELDTFTPDGDEMVSVDFDYINDFDYVLGKLAQVIEGPAYEWDGPQTMRFIFMLVKNHLEAHSEPTEFQFDDVDKIREALNR